MSSSNNNIDLSILFWNARGLRNKFTELKAYIRKENIDIVGINETFLDDSTNLENFNGYEIVRAD